MDWSKGAVAILCVLAEESPEHDGVSRRPCLYERFHEVTDDFLGACRSGHARIVALRSLCRRIGHPDRPGLPRSAGSPRRPHHRAKSRSSGALRRSGLAIRRQSFLRLQFLSVGLESEKQKTSLSREAQPAIERK